MHVYTHVFTEFNTHAYRHSNTHVYTYDGMQVEIAMQKLSNLIHFLLLITVLTVTFIQMEIMGISHSSRLSFFCPIEGVQMGLNYLIRLWLFQSNTMHQRIYFLIISLELVECCVCTQPAKLDTWKHCAKLFLYVLKDGHLCNHLYKRNSACPTLLTQLCTTLFN